jgi:hypothetical protein
MWPRRHRGQPTEPPSAREQLWEDLRDFFQDDEGWRWASGTVWFVEVDPEDVRRLWDHICAKATSFGDEPRILDFDHETPQDIPLVEAVDLMLRGADMSTSAILSPELERVVVLSCPSTSVPPLGSQVPDPRRIYVLGERRPLSMAADGTSVPP